MIDECFPEVLPSLLIAQIEFIYLSAVDSDTTNKRRKYICIAVSCSQALWASGSFSYGVLHYGTDWLPSQQYFVGVYMSLLNWSRRRTHLYFPAIYGRIPEVFGQFLVITDNLVWFLSNMSSRVLLQKPEMYASMYMAMMIITISRC